MMAGGVVMTMVVVGCRKTGGVIVAAIVAVVAGDAEEAAAVLIGVALASRCENAAGGRVIWVRIGGLFGLFFSLHSSQAAT